MTLQPAIGTVDLLHGERKEVRKQSVRNYEKNRDASVGATVKTEKKRTGFARRWWSILLALITLTASVSTILEKKARVLDTQRTIAEVVFDKDLREICVDDMYSF